MISKLKRKPVIIGIICFIVVALVLGLTVPAMAAGSPPWAPRAGGNKNNTVVQGTITALSSTSITITPTSGSAVTLTLNSSTNFNIHGNSWLTSAPLIGDSVTATYNQTVTPLVASQVMINMPAVTPNTVNPPANRNFARAQGTISTLGTTTGSIMSITLTSNATGTFTSGQTVSVVASPSSGTPRTTPGNNFARAQGTISTLGTTTGSIMSITLTSNATGTFTSGETVSIIPSPPSGTPGPRNFHGRFGGFPQSQF